MSYKSKNMKAQRSIISDRAKDLSKRLIEIQQNSKMSRKYLKQIYQPYYRKVIASERYGLAYQSQKIQQNFTQNLSDIQAQEEKQRKYNSDEIFIEQKILKQEKVQQLNKDKAQAIVNSSQNRSIAKQRKSILKKTQQNLTKETKNSCLLHKLKNKEENIVKQRKIDYIAVDSSNQELLLSKKERKYLIEDYTPTLFETEQIIRITSAMAKVTETNLYGINYLKRVFQEYRSLNGQMSEKQLSVKLIGDSIYQKKYQMNKFDELMKK